MKHINQFSVILVSVFFVWIFFCAPSSALSTPPADEFPDTAENFADVSDFFAHQKNYVPGEPLNRTVKTVYLSFNIWLRSDGTGVFTDEEYINNKLHELVERLNRIFYSTPLPSSPIEGVDYLRDSHIQFELKAIDYYRNSDLYTATCSSGPRLNRYVFRKHPQKRQYLNIHLTSGNCRGATGYANYPSGRNLESDSYLVSFLRQDADQYAYGYWAFMLHIAHELGHNFELRHPYDSEFCRFSHPDFLFDLFGFEKQDWCNNPRSNCDVCFQQGKWDCPIDDPQTTCTNNIMGGNSDSGSITPLQMGRMNRTLAIRSLRKYAWGYSEEPFEVETSQQWTFNKKFYQDIRVASGVTLYLKGTLEMVPEARIILEPGSKLIVDGGLITNAMYSKSLWQGVIIEPVASRGLAFWRKKKSPGELIILNNGSIINSMQ